MIVGWITPLMVSVSGVVLKTASTSELRGPAGVTGGRMRNGQ